MARMMLIYNIGFAQRLTYFHNFPCTVPASSAIVAWLSCVFSVILTGFDDLQCYDDVPLKATCPISRHCHHPFFVCHKNDNFNFICFAAALSISCHANPFLLFVRFKVALGDNTQCDFALFSLFIVVLCCFFFQWTFLAFTIPVWIHFFTITEAHIDKAHHFLSFFYKFVSKSRKNVDFFLSSFTLMLFLFVLRWMLNVYDMRAPVVCWSKSHREQMYGVVAVVAVVVCMFAVFAFLFCISILKDMFYFCCTFFYIHSTMFKCGFYFFLFNGVNIYFIFISLARLFVGQHMNKSPPNNDITNGLCAPLFYIVNIVIFVFHIFLYKCVFFRWVSFRIVFLSIRPHTPSTCKFYTFFRENDCGRLRNLFSTNKKKHRFHWDY